MLGRALAMEWVSRVIFLEAAICVAGNLSAYVMMGYPRRTSRVVGVAFKQPVIILHVSFRAISTCPASMFGTALGEQANSGVEKQTIDRPPTFTPGLHVTEYL